MIRGFRHCWESAWPLPLLELSKPIKHLLYILHCKLKWLHFFLASKGKEPLVYHLQNWLFRGVKSEKIDLMCDGQEKQLDWILLNNCAPTSTHSWIMLEMYQFLFLLLPDPISMSDNGSVMRTKQQLEAGSFQYNFLWMLIRQSWKHSRNWS